MTPTIRALDSDVQGDKHSRVHSVLDELEKPVLVLIFGSKSFIHDLLSCVTTKLVGRTNVNICGVRCFFSLQVRCSEAKCVRTDGMSGIRQNCRFMHILVRHFGSDLH